VEAMGDPRHNLHAHTATMAGAQQVVVVHGSARAAAGVHSGNGCLGPGFPANAAIGRSTRLVLRNLCRSVPGEFDRAGFSHPGRYGWCFGEAEEESPWPPLADELGCGGRPAVSVYATT